MKYECQLYVRPDLVEIGTKRRAAKLQRPLKAAAQFDPVFLPTQVSIKFWHLVDVLDMIVEPAV